VTKNNALWAFSVAIGLFLVSGPLSAHHSEAALDKDNASTVITPMAFQLP
jgi:hypothetical protein